PAAPTPTEPRSGSESWATASSSAHAGPKTESMASAMRVLPNRDCRVAAFIIFLRRSAEVELRGRVRGAGVVRPVHLRMAVRAAAGHDVVDARLAARDRAEERGLPAQVGVLPLADDLADLPAVRRVALVAEERRTRLQHVLGGRAVRVVAVRAVLAHRLVVVHERAALLHVARVAGVVDGVALHERGPGRAVRVVAVGARHLPFGDRMVRGLVDLGALLLVAVEAHLGLRALVAHRVVPGVDLVAVGAREAARLVHAPGPVGALRVRVVAAEALAVLLVRRALA